MTERPAIVRDPSTGRPILVAPQRRDRPVHTDPSRDEGACPFCPGEEHQTPPEVDAVRPDGSAPGQPGWRARAFPNLYPATDWHEVVAEGPQHSTQPGDLDAALWQDVLALELRRMRSMEAQPGVRCAFLFKNVGRLAGASVAHNHSQILGLPMLPPRLELELLHNRQQCVPCAELENAEREGRVVLAGASHVALCPRTPKLPFETWLLPTRHASELPAAGAPADPAELVELKDLADALQRLYAAVDRAFASPPFNAWLHRVPGEDFHWHFELQPRTGFLAGLEIGGDMYINSISAADAASRLRG